MSQTRRYKLLDRIAVGGTAEVFRALASTALGEEAVVLKRVLPQLARDDRFRRLFAEEARVVAALDHPNIVRIVDFGELDGTCFIALEAVDGRDLGALLRSAAERNERIPPAVAARIVAEVARALQFAHEQVSAAGVPLQIIHRDVSPQNILVSFRGDVKLTDFGIAQSSLSSGGPAEGGLRGKLDYMAPEQATGGVVDHRSDLFALGCVLYQLLAARPPFQGVDEQETQERLQALRPLVPVRELDAPVELRAALEHLLRRLPSERFQQAKELLRHLEAYLERHGAALAPAALGSWARRLADDDAGEVSTPEASVDDAVRALLGDPADDGQDDELDGYEPGARPGRERAATGQVPTFAVQNSTVPILQAHDLETEPRAAPASAPVRHVVTAETAQPTAPSMLRYWPWGLALVLALLGSAALGWLLHRRAGGSSSAADRGVALSRRDTRPSALPSPTDAAPASPRRTWIRSKPIGATLSIDGVAQGVTPRALTLPAVPFVLELRKPGHRPHRATHQAPPDGQDIVVRLQRITRAIKVGKVGYLTVNSLPWTRVYLQGRYLGNTPLLRRALRPGRHRIVLRSAAGRVRKRFEAQIDSGRTRTYSFDLRKP